MSQTVTCRLGAESAFWRPDPFPGSGPAREQGCICPEKQPWPGSLTYDTGCPVEAHQLVKVADALDE